MSGWSSTRHLWRSRLALRFRRTPAVRTACPPDPVCGGDRRVVGAAGVALLWPERLCTLLAADAGPGAETSSLAADPSLDQALPTDVLEKTPLRAIAPTPRGDFR